MYILYAYGEIVHVDEKEENINIIEFCAIEAYSNQL